MKGNLMKTPTQSLILAVVLNTCMSGLAIQAQAGSTYSKDQSEAAPIYACSEVNVREQEPGFRCKTSVGATFEVVYSDQFGKGVKGPDGVIWGEIIDVSSKFGTAALAMSACSSLGGTLPSYYDYIRANRSGILEVLQDMRRHLFMTSTPGNGLDSFNYYTYQELHPNPYAQVAVPVSTRCIEVSKRLEKTQALSQSNSNDATEAETAAGRSAQ
jgi:hypothetical protein